MVVGVATIKVPRQESQENAVENISFAIPVEEGFSSSQSFMLFTCNVLMYLMCLKVQFKCHLVKPTVLNFEPKLSIQD